MPDNDQKRWRAMPVRAALVRAFITLAPLGLAFVVASYVARWVGRPSGFAEHAIWWMAVLGSSSLVIAAGERVTRRLLPLHALLTLSMAFPDRAPRRMKIARRAGNVEALKEQFARMARQTRGDPNEAAELVLSLVTALSSHDRRTRGHSERVRVYADLLADSMGLPAHAKDRLRWAALLHDIGKLDVAAEILNKPGKPDGDEWATLTRHPEWGARFAAPLREWLGEWAPAIEHHHERYDGTGYPAGLSGEQISLGGRIVAVADSFEVMTTARPYKRAMRVSAAREELVRCAGTQFDPGVVRAFLNISIRRVKLVAGVLPSIFQVPVIQGLAPAVPRTVVGTIAVVGGSLFGGPAAVAPEADLPSRLAAPPAVSIDSDAFDFGSGSGTEEFGEAQDGAPAPTVSDPPRPAFSPKPVPSTRPSSDPGLMPGSPPVARADRASTPEDRATTIDVLANDTDPDGDMDPSTLRVSTPPATGKAVPTSSGKIRFTPEDDYHGSAVFSYTVCDLTARCDVAAVGVTVLPLPDPPTARDDEAAALVMLPTMIAVSANDSDPDGDLDEGSVAIVSAPSNGEVEVNGDGTVTYTADLFFRGTDTFHYRICDEAGVCDEAKVTVEVLPWPAET